MTVLVAPPAFRVRRAPERRDPRKWVLTAGLLIVLLLMVLGPYLSYKPKPFTGEGNPLRQSGYMIALALVVGASRPLQNPRALMAIPLSLVVALGWCAFSLTWSIAPDIGLRRLLFTVMIIWTIFVATGRLGFRATSGIVRVALVLVLVANYVTVWLFPSVGIHQFDLLFESSIAGSWRGMLLHKNFAGAVCAVTIMFFVFDARRISPMVRAAVILGAAGFLYGTESKTSGSLLVVTLLAGAAFLRYNPRYRALLIPATMIVFAALALGAVIFGDTLLKPLDDPRAFTGRAQIWPIMFHYIRDHWLLGAGYGSFWNIGPGGSPAFRYGHGWVADLGNGHNGYLDMLAQIGAPGLVLVVAATLIVPLVRLLASRTAPRSQGALCLAILIFCAGHNLTETSLLERDTFVEVFLMLSIALTARATRGEPSGATSLTVRQRSPWLR